LWRCSTSLFSRYMNFTTVCTSPEACLRMLWKTTTPKWPLRYGRLHCCQQLYLKW
jgi:hypothetical protein